MESHTQLSDIDFEVQFANCQLAPSLFNHEAHLRLAWIHIKKYGVEKALNNIQQQLLQFVSHLGAKDKYNTTLTVAAIKAVDHFITKSKSDRFNEFILEFPQLKTKFKELMASHYSIDIFNSPKAKNSYLAPDLLPFD